MDEVQKEILVATIKKKFDQTKAELTEKERRAWVGSESLKIGHGGDGIVQKATGLSRPTIRKGRNEIQNGYRNSPEHIRKAGGGRKSIVKKYPGILKKLDSLIDPFSREEGKHPTLRWTRKSTAVLTNELNELLNPVAKDKRKPEPEKETIKISQRTLYSILKNLGYDMSINQRKNHPKSIPLMDIQLHVIYEEVKKHNQNGLPVVSIDLMKSRFSNGHLDDSLEMNMDGWEKIPVEDHTALSVMDSLQQWLDEADHMSQLNFPGILITVDGEKKENLKQGLQELSNKNQIRIRLCHFPPCTRKWNKVDQKTFFPFSVNQTSKKTEKYCSVVNLITNPTIINRVKNADGLNYDLAINLKSNKQLEAWNDLFVPMTVPKS